MCLLREEFQFLSFFFSSIFILKNKKSKISNEESRKIRTGHNLLYDDIRNDFSVSYKSYGG